MLDTGLFFILAVLVSDARRPRTRALGLGALLTMGVLPVHQAETPGNETG